jgi:diadenosine tetraphosphate (Ap4A) HIT family hydrolase
MGESPEYCDVTDLAELPLLPRGWRYFDFIGGTKEFRCFVAPEDMPRNKFMADNEERFDECLKHVYKNNGIIVKQDASFALPGFYIVSHLHHYHSLDEFDEVTHLRMFFILREIRKGMRERLGIQNIHIYYEERAVVSHNVHYWLVPITDIEKHPRLYNFDVKKYLDQFLFSQNRDRIMQCNNLMKKYIQDVNLVERDNVLTKTLITAQKNYE